MIEEENGSALIWFVFLVALLALVVLILASSIHQYLFARELTDFTEQFAVALKSMLQLDPGLDLSKAANSLLSDVSSMYSFSELRIKSLSLESGETVRVIFCAKWSSPVSSVETTRTICEIAMAR